MLVKFLVMIVFILFAATVIQKAIKAFKEAGKDKAIDTIIEDAADVQRQIYKIEGVDVEFINKQKEKLSQLTK